LTQGLAFVSSAHWFSVLHQKKVLAMSCHGKVALVTGSSRGIGRGIALALAKEGACVYITGRKKADGVLEKTEAEIKAAAAHGGSCKAMICDHNDDAAIEQLVENIFSQEKHLDILVNNAFSGGDVDPGTDQTKQDLGSQPFWSKPFKHWDNFHRVGLRCHYIATAVCARRWVPAGQRALVVNISSAAGFGHTWDVAYGVGKAAVDRLSADAAKELKEHGIAVVSLWPGAVATELVQGVIAQGGNSLTMDGLFAEMESVEFSGRGIAALAADPDNMRFTGKVVMTPNLAEEYKFTDVNGTLPWGKFLPMLRKGMKFPPAMWVLPKPKAKL